MAGLLRSYRMPGQFRGQPPTAELLARGLWLQTPVSRPEMIRGGGTFQPVHFVGLLAEGNISSPAAGLGYNVGIGNGRGAVISRGGDSGDVNRNRAWVAKLFARPGALYGIEFGGVRCTTTSSAWRTPPGFRN